MPIFALVIIISSLTCILMALMPSLTIFLAVLWGTTLVIGGLYLKHLQLILIFMLNIIILYMVSGLTSLLFYLTFFGAAAFTMSYLASQNWGYYQLQKWGIITSILGVSLFLLLIYFGTGDIGISQVEADLNSYVQQTINAYEEAGLFELYEAKGVTRANLEANFARMAMAISRHLPAFYYLQAIMVVFFMLFLASYVSLKRNLERLIKRPYSEEIMPWQLVWVVIAGLALWLLGRGQASYLYYAGSNILVVLAPITVYFGLSAVLFKMKQRSAGSRRWMVLGLIILAVVFPLAVIVFLGLIGLFDALIDYRKLRIE